MKKKAYSHGATAIVVVAAVKLEHPLLQRKFIGQKASATTTTKYIYTSRMEM